ncbi:MAG: iron-sulfur cluster assembly scaffold protein [Parachlamydiaceae bacterium]
MGIATLVASFPWMRYSKKLTAKIENPRSVGWFTSEEAEARLMRLAQGKGGSVAAGNAVIIYWLVDKDDGIIVDAKFQVYGQSVLIGAAEATCELLIGKNYDQARRVTADLIDKQMRDRSDVPAFPKETYPHLNLVLEAIDEAAEQCTDIPFADTYIAPPVPADFGQVVPGGYPGWMELPLKKKIAVIEQVMDQDLRPYIALDGGGVTVLNLLNDKELVISYQGSCTSCYSSIGTTLSYIQQVIRAKVHPNIVVVPDINTSLS